MFPRKIQRHNYEVHSCPQRFLTAAQRNHFSMSTETRCICIRHWRSLELGRTWIWPLQRASSSVPQRNLRTSDTEMIPSYKPLSQNSKSEPGDKYSRREVLIDMVPACGICAGCTGLHNRCHRAEGVSAEITGYNRYLPKKFLWSRAGGRRSRRELWGWTLHDTCEPDMSDC